MDAGISVLRSSGMTTHVNKVYHVTTITQGRRTSVKTKTVAIEMEIDDGLIWVYGVGEDGVQAFTDFSIET